MVEFGQDADQAWYMTPQEYFMLHDWRMDKLIASGQYHPPMTKQEGDDLMAKVAALEAIHGER